MSQLPKMDKCPPVHVIKSVGVFGGSTLGKNAEYIATAVALGVKISERNMTLIYGGGSCGLTGCVAQAAIVHGARTYGVIPTPMTKAFGRTMGYEVRTKSLHERMALIITSSDAIIALPGDFGTLEQMFNVISWAQLNMHAKPIGLLNVNKFFDGLLAFLDYMMKQKFISPVARKIVISAPSIDELFEKLSSYVPLRDPDIAQIDWSNPESSKGKRKLEVSAHVDLTIPESRKGKRKVDEGPHIQWPILESSDQKNSEELDLELRL